MSFYLYDLAAKRVHAAALREKTAHEGCSDCTHTKAWWLPLCTLARQGDLNLADPMMFAKGRTFEDSTHTPIVVATDKRVTCQQCAKALVQFEKGDIRE